MMNNEQRAFLRAYAAGACASVADALDEIGLKGDSYREMAKDPDFARELHQMLASLESAPPPDPFDFAPEPPVVCSLAGVQFAIDPFGPLYGSFAYDHATRRFTNGKRISETLPGDIEWFNAAASWPKGG